MVAMLLITAVFSPKMRAADTDDARVDTVDFWTTTVDLYKRAGYTPDSEFLRHANTNLRRVETLHGHKGKVSGSTSSKLASLLSLGRSAQKPHEKIDHRTKEYRDKKMDHRTKEYRDWEKSKSGKKAKTTHKSKTEKSASGKDIKSGKHKKAVKKSTIKD